MHAVATTLNNLGLAVFPFSLEEIGERLLILIILCVMQYFLKLRVL